MAVPVYTTKRSCTVLIAIVMTVMMMCTADKEAAA